MSLSLCPCCPQEVRYDTSLHSYGKHAQIAHLASLLPEYQYVYQPASLYFHADTYPSHDEEGCAIFSKHPIIHSDYLVRCNSWDALFEDVQLLTWLWCANSWSAKTAAIGKTSTNVCACMP